MPDRIFVVYDANFYALHGKKLERSWQASRRPVESIVCPSGEGHKTIECVTYLHNHLIKQGISRNDIIIACGGGVTSDVVGFSASIVLRGIRWGVCATTLLGMVDASIGGKTGVDHPNGKNLIGSYWQPSFVIDDIQWLETLPPREFKSGMAEVIKSAGLSGGKLLGQLLQVGNDLSSVSQSELVALISGAVEYKASVVGRDERDQSVRLRLNFGHTIGHAIEQSLNFKRLTHGEAIILGMIGAMEIADRLGLSRADKLGGFTRAIMSALSDLPAIRLNPDRILSAVESDKKRTTEGTRFVLLPLPGKPIVRPVPRKVVVAAVEEMIRICRER